MKWRKLKKKFVENLHDITKHALYCIQLHQLFDQIVCYLSILFILHRKILSFVSNKCKFHVLRENVHPTDLMSLPKLESEKRNNTQHIDRCHLNLFLVHFALQNTEKAQRTQHFENSFSMFFFLSVWSFVWNFIRLNSSRWISVLKKYVWVHVMSKKVSIQLSWNNCQSDVFIGRYRIRECRSKCVWFVWAECVH